MTISIKIFGRSIPFELESSVTAVNSLRIEYKGLNENLLFVIYATQVKADVHMRLFLLGSHLLSLELVSVIHVGGIVFGDDHPVSKLASS